MENIAKFASPPTQMALLRVNKAFHQAVIDADDYDQFTKELKDFKRSDTENLMVSKDVRLPEELNDLELFDIARHAWQTIVERINIWLQKNRKAWSHLDKLASMAKKEEGGFGSYSRVVATANKSGQVNYAVNFLGKNDTLAANNAEKKLTVTPNKEVNKSYEMYHSHQHYQKTPQMHAEMRIKQTQYALEHSHEGHDEEIGVEMACCIFCASQMMAMGGTKINAFHLSELAWYKFSGWIMFFKANRRELWGPEIEKIFNFITADAKMAVLYNLMRLTSMSERDRKPETPLEEIKKSLGVNLK